MHLLSALLVVHAALQAPDTSVSVTYTSRAARAPIVLKQLSELTKVSLVCSPQMNSEVLAIAVQDVSLADLMKRIATATSGDWKQEGNQYRLVENSTLRRKEDRYEADLALAAVRKAILKREKDAIDLQKRFQAEIEKAEKEEAAAKAKSGKTGDSGKKGNEAGVDTPDITEAWSGRNPDEETFTALLKGIDPVPIAQMTDESRVVYSTDPTRMQHPLGPDAIDIINAFIRKHNESVAKLPPDEFDTINSGMEPQMAERMRRMMQRRNAKIGPVSKALLIVSRSGLFMMGMDTLTLRLYDTKGSVLFNANSNLSTDADSPMAVAMAEAERADDSEANKEKSAKTGTPINLSQDSKELLTVFGNFGSPNPSVKLSESLKKKLQNPSAFDPLSFTATDAAFAYGAYAQKPFVADLPDEAQNQLAALGESAARPTLEEIIKEVKDAKSWALVDDPTFTVIKPARPSRSRINRMDREALTALLAAASEKLLPSLDDMAAFAIANPTSRQYSSATMYLFLFVPGSLQNLLTGGGVAPLRFYGRLPLELRSALLANGKVPISALPGEAHAELETMVYGSGSGLEVDNGQKQPEDGLPSYMRIAMMDTDATDFRTEPTEILPNGLPSDGLVELKAQQESFAMMASQTNSMMDMMFGALGPEEIALFDSLKSQKGAEMMAGFLPALDKMRVGTTTKLDFTFRVAPQVVCRHSLKDHKIDKNSAIVSRSGLPADFQKQIAAFAAKQKGNPIFNIGAMFGGGNAIHP